MRAHAEIAAAVMAGDGALARSRMRKHLQAEADFFRRRRSTRTAAPRLSGAAGAVGSGKGAETVARNITQAIVVEGLQPGDLVGTEPELIEREGVSRALLREAVRLLEHHQIARMRRGPGGGLFVEGAEHPGGHRGGRDLSGPPGHAAARAGRAANRRRGRHRRPCGGAHRRRGRGGAPRGFGSRGARHRRRTGRSGARPARRRGHCRPQPGTSPRCPGAHPPQPAAPDRALGPEGAQADQPPRCCTPTRASHGRSRTAIASWPGIACAGTSKPSAPLCADRALSLSPRT